MKIKITAELLGDLRQKIEACASKEWLINNPKKHDPDFSGISGIRTSDGYPVIYWSDHPHEGIYLESYADHIAAANPAVVLALIEEIEQLRSIKNELVEELSCVLQHTDLSGWSLGEQIEKSATDLLRKISKTS